MMVKYQNTQVVYSEWELFRFCFVLKQKYYSHLDCFLLLTISPAAAFCFLQQCHCRYTK